MQQRYAEIFTVGLREPQLGLDARKQPRRPSRPCSSIASPLLRPSSVEGIVSVSSALKYDAASASAAARTSRRAERIELQGLGGRDAERLQQIGAVVAQELLRDQALRTFTAEELTVGRKTYEIGDITVQQDGITGAAQMNPGQTMFPFRLLCGMRLLAGWRGAGRRHGSATSTCRPIAAGAHSRPRTRWPPFRTRWRSASSTLELDIGLTADGVVVISHDTALNPDHTRDARGAFLAAKGPAIRSLTLAQLQRYDVGRIDPATSYGKQFATQLASDGERIPTLAALFERVRERGATCSCASTSRPSWTRPAPTKPRAPEAMVRALLAEIDKAGMAARVTIQSFDWRTLALVGQMAPQMSRAYLTTGRTLRDRALDHGPAARGLRLGAAAREGRRRREARAR